MSPLLVLLAYVTAVNPAFVRPALPEDDGRARPAAALGGGAIVAVAVLVLVVLADSLLDWLDVSFEAWRIAAGIVVGLAGARAVVSPQSAAEPELTGTGAALVPVAFPLLFTPQLAVLAVLFGATESLLLAWGAALVALAAAVAVGSVSMRRPLLWAAASRLAGAMLVVVCVALVIAGVRDV